MRWERASGWWRPVLFSGVFLVGDIGWVLPACDGRIPVYVWVITLVIAVLFVVSVVWMFRDLLDGQPALEDGADYDASFSVSRIDRLRLMSPYLPQSLPAGWTKRTNERGSIGWRFHVGDVLVVAWARKGRYGAFIRVAMSHLRSPEPVDVAEAEAILEHFRDVSEFVEMDVPPAALQKRYPVVRVWFAHAIDAQAVPKQRPAKPAPAHTPLRELVRVLLPSKLPAGWSPPVAVEESRDGWMLLVNDRLLMATPFSPGEGLQLHVAVVGEPEDEVTVTEALDILQHIRGVGDFRQVDEADELPFARSFVADIRGAEGVKFEPRDLN